MTDLDAEDIALIIGKQWMVVEHESKLHVVPLADELDGEPFDHSPDDCECNPVPTPFQNVDDPNVWVWRISHNAMDGRG